MPITEHPFDGSWGYQPVGYFAPTSRFGTPDDFAYFVDYPAPARLSASSSTGFPPTSPMTRTGWATSTAPTSTSIPTRGWASTATGAPRSSTTAAPRSATSSSATPSSGSIATTSTACGSMRWPRCSISTIRASPANGSPTQFGGNENLEAIDFLKRLNELCHREHPGVLTIAEESTSWSGVSRPTYLGGLGFSLKWNMGWMNDTLRYLSKDPVYRKYEHGSLTFSMIYAFTENFILPLSHDEVVHGKGSLLDKMPGDLWQKFANLRLLYGYMYGHPGKKLLFMGSEIAQWREWNHDESLDWHLLQWRDHQGMLQPGLRPESSLSLDAGPLPGRFRMAGLRMARAARLGKQRDRLPAPRPQTRRRHSLVVVATSRPWFAITTGSAFRPADTTARSSTPTPKSTAGQTSAITAEPGESTSPTRGSLFICRCACPRWPRST